jgi:hypothetical protein
VKDESAQQSSHASKSDIQNSPSERDGQHGFDFEIGSWKIHLSRLQDRLAGSTTWVQFDGTSVTRKVWNGRANLEEFEADSSQGHIEGLTLRLYNPHARQWSIYLGEQQERHLRPTHDRRVQEWPRRVLRPGAMEGQSSLCSIYLVEYHHEIAPL